MLEIITLILTINVGRLPFVYGLCSIIKNIHVVLHVSFQCENVICLQPRKLSEKAVATHSSTLAWKIPQTEEPGGLQSMGSYRVGHDWSDLAAAAAKSLTCAPSLQFFGITLWAALLQDFQTEGRVGVSSAPGSSNASGELLPSFLSPGFNPTGGSSQYPSLSLSVSWAPPSPGVVLSASLWDGKPPYVTVYLIPCSTVHVHKCQTLVLQHWLLENTQTSLLSKNLTPHTKTLQMEITAVVFDVHFESLSWKLGTQSHLYSSARYCKAPCVTGIELCPKRGLVFALGSWGAYL